MSQVIIPSLWFDHVARGAVDFYLDVFPDARQTHIAHYPAEGLPDFQQEFAGEVLEIGFSIDGFEFSAINAGPEFAINPSISFMLNFDPSTMPDARDRLDALWARLIDGGSALMDLDSYDWSARYGWLQDRFGVNWQLMLTDPAGEPRPFVIPQFMFPYRSARAHEALQYWTSVFPDARQGTVVGYQPDQGQPDGTILFSDFQLAGQWFSAMDSGAQLPEGFDLNEAVSLTVQCADQAEIDHFWQALSAVPEAEQCGWCKDRFGVSWQVVPAAMEELMARPGAYQKMLAMKKLVIADF
ncbi:VOC family protein [Propionibacterium freudenreichii]|uniref:VOC family protein n=1 Tax=Propionibacterium freudenreichii TaxID=1744 RepID=UPI001109EE4B|nr:VOC family protein [Propionibacterium freudenreichii]MCT2976680.1 VOC family protein [Propionibacterium freudenreichii]MDK9351522.1 VOC family protein [Propionibacterium freudenreichii]